MRNEVNRALVAKKKKLLNQLIRRGSGVNLLRYAAMVVVLFTLGVGNAWAGDHYYTDFKATGGATGKGYVYAGTSSTDTPVYVETSDDIETSEPGSGASTTYYAWAKAVRGADFKSWSLSSATLTTNYGGTADVITVTAPTSDGTTNGVATATWTTYAKVNVTYNASDDGEYTVAYSYNTYDATNKTITAGDAERLGCTINSDNGSKTIGSYYNDVITLTSTKGDFQGWYKASDTNNSSNLLSTDNPYTYVAPQSGTGTVYPKYAHVDKYYGRLTASIAAVPYSMPAGGMIFISKEASATPTYSENAQTVDNVGLGSTSLTYYLKAQPTDKRYVFRGWYSNAQCTGTPISTNKEYTYSFTASSTNSSSPTEGNVYAAFDFNLYYMEVQAQPATPGLGMVLVSDTKLTSPAYTEFSSESSQFAYAYRLTHTTDVYVYAKPKYGYKLSGWYSDAACTQAVTVASDGKYTASSTASTDPMNPDTITLYAKFVEDATTVNITYNLPDQSKGEYTASVLDIEEVDDEYVWTFTEVFTSVGKTANTVQAQHKTDVLRLEAACKAGYGVTSWTDAGTAKTTPSHLYETTGTATGKTYGVTFGDAKPFLVSTNSTQYATLAEALTAVGSSGKITVVQNAYVESGDYTIPSGVSLIVPYESTGKSYTAPTSSYEKATAFSSATQYVLLTLGSGVNITISGSLIVMADLCAPNGGGAGSGAPLTAYGRIAMSKNSAITVNSGANLYCWGFITGTEGLVTVKNGGKVYELFQHQNNPGGSAASGWNEKAFFLNQYYVQNIESPLKIEYGATEIVYAQITVPSGSINNLSTTLIGKDNTGMFALTSSNSYLVRTYNPATDRTTYDIYGNAKLNYISMTVYGMDLNTSLYVLPITHNMSVKCHALAGINSTFDILYSVSLLPGSELIIDEGVTVGVNNKFIIYDRDEWIDKGFAQFNLHSGGSNWSRSSFTPTRTYTRTKADLVDAKVDLNGTMSVSGSLYTTTNGAAIISSNGTGTINLSAAAPGNSNDIQYSNNKLGTSVNVPITPAKLLNADGSYLATAGAAKNDKFIYSKNLDKWMKNPKTITWNANGGTTEATTMAYSQDAFIGELPAAYKEGHTLSGWFTAASGGTQIAATNKVTANATYYAHWTPKQYNITYMDQGKAAFSGTHVDSPNAHPTKHTYGTATTLNGANDKTGYEFGGWHTISNCKAESKVTSLGATAVSKDITLYAKWTPQEYTITWKDGTETIQTEEWAYGSTPSFAYEKPAIPQETYELYGWSDGNTQYALNALPAVTNDVTYTALYTSTPRIYTIRFLNGNDVLQTSQIQYGAMPNYDGATPTKSGDGKRSYTFKGWSPEVVDVEGDQDYIAQYSMSISVDEEDGEVVITEDETATVTMVKVSGRLNVAATLTTDDLILEGTTASSGEIAGTVNATRAFYDLSNEGGFEADKWYSFAVPWQVDATNGSHGIQLKNGETFSDPILDKTMHITYYNGENRGKYGKGNNDWNYVADDADKTLIPGRLYMIYLTTSTPAIRFTRIAETPLDNNAENVHLYAEETGRNGLDANWNGIANPKTYHAYLNAGVDVTSGQAFNAKTQQYVEFKLDENKLFVGQPVFVQAIKENSVVANADDYNPAPAQRRNINPALREDYEVHISANGQTNDHVRLYVDEDKEADRYTIGQDLAKMGVSNRVPQMWVNRYNTQLCVNTIAPVSGTAEYPLGIFTPAAGEYNISVMDAENHEANVYLTYNGYAIWNLSNGAYTAWLPKGNIMQYGLRLTRKQPGTVTNIDEATAGNNEKDIRKVVMDDHVYIIRDGKVYSVDGQLVK